MLHERQALVLRDVRQNEIDLPIRVEIHRLDPPGAVKQLKRRYRMGSRLEPGPRGRPEPQRPQKSIAPAHALVALALDEIGDAVPVHVGQVRRRVAVVDPIRPVDQVLGARNAGVMQRECVLRGGDQDAPGGREVERRPMDVVNQNVRQAILVVVDRRAVVGLNLQVGLLLKNRIVGAVVVIFRIGDYRRLEKMGKGLVAGFSVRNFHFLSQRMGRRLRLRSVPFFQDGDLRELPRRLRLREYRRLEPTALRPGPTKPM